MTVNKKLLHKKTLKKLAEIEKVANSINNPSKDVFAFTKTNPKNLRFLGLVFDFPLFIDLQGKHKEIEKEILKRTNEILKRNIEL